MKTIRCRCALWFVLLCGLLQTEPVFGQLPLGGSNQIPDIRYYGIFLDYYQGNYRDAARDFASTPGAIRSGTDRYLDSACFWTMAGECNFHTGNFGQAIEFYENALGLYLDFIRNGWQERIQLPPAVNPRNGAVQAAQITWGQSRRTGSVSSLPDSLQVLFGRLDNERVLNQGGVVQNPEFRAVDVAEVMRCTALALHRRRMIKGVTCRLDPMSSRIVEDLSPLGGGDGTLLGAWNGIVLGIAHAGIEEFDKAQRQIIQSLQFGGGMDHPLTPIGLLELAIINYQQGDLAKAADFALEASYSAAIYNQYDLLEESLALGTTIHLIRNRSEYPPLQPAIAWAARNKARLPQISLMIRLAECYSEAGDTVASAQVLNDASKGAARLSNQLVGRVGYLTALNLFLDGQYDNGRTQLATALESFSSSSRWLYQLGLADSLTLKKQITDRESDILYGLLLRDPLDIEWISEPIEAMTFLTSNHLEPIERWFAIAVANKDFEHAIEIAELLKRHRFYSTVPLAGRQLGFRWMMHAPEEAVSKDVLAQRTDFLARFPAYKQLAEQSDKTRESLLAMPIQTEPDTDERQAQSEAYVELMRVSQLQEAALASFALRREPSKLVFPPTILASTVRNEIDSDQLIIYTVATSNAVYFFTIDLQGAKLLSWQTTKKVANDINQLFRESNLAERQLDPDMLTDEIWKTVSFQIASNWLPQMDLSPIEGTGEVIIVPDGLLWYLPFELLRFGADPASAKMLFELGATRYSPTLGLALEAQRPHKPWTRTAIFSGPLADRFDLAWTQARVAEYQTLAPTIVNFEERLDFPSNLFNSIIDQVVVWTETVRGQKGSPYGLVPLEKDRGKNGSNLAAWLSLPFEGAEHVVLPCFAGDGESGVKPRTDGHEYFITTCAMLASGARTIMISRWNVAGDSTLQLSRKYLDGVAKDYSPAQALHLAATELVSTKLDWNKETRLKPTKTPPEITGTHPLFWSGYLVIDVPTKHVFTNPQETGKPADAESQELNAESKLVEPPPGKVEQNPPGKEGKDDVKDEDKDGQRVPPNEREEDDGKGGKSTAPAGQRTKKSQR